jgi:hypothetical protein
MSTVRSSRILSLTKTIKRTRHPHHPIAKNLVKSLKVREAELAVYMQQCFEPLMKELPANEKGLFLLHPLRNGEDINHVATGPGMYIILSDIVLDGNKCRLCIDGLTAVYRGHSYEVRERIRSHLDHPAHRTVKGSGAWNQCLKLGGLEDRVTGGLNINSEALQGTKWAVLVLRLLDSSEFQREQAEWAFDEIFGLPLGSAGEKSVKPTI